MNQAYIKNIFYIFIKSFGRKNGEETCTLSRADQQLWAAASAANATTSQYAFA
jgi:hypothetical protein